MKNKNIRINTSVEYFPADVFERGTFSYYEKYFVFNGNSFGDFYFKVGAVLFIYRLD